MSIRNPYKQANTGQPLKRIACDVSEDAYRKLKQFYPDQGLQDSLLSSLFYTFFNDFLRLNLTPPSTPDEFTTAKNELRRLVQRRANSSTP